MFLNILPLSFFSCHNLKHERFRLTNLYLSRHKFFQVSALTLKVSVLVCTQAKWPTQLEAIQVFLA